MSLIRTALLRLLLPLPIMMVAILPFPGTSRAVSGHQPAATTVQATLINTISTSAWHPACPDPSGITYWPARNRLMLVDGEVDEMSIYTGANIFQSTRDGRLTDVGTTKPWSSEPVGIDLGFNPLTQHFFISDDNQKRVFDVDIGRDGRLGTGDDRVRSFSTRVYGNDDPEGLTFDDAGILYMTNGAGSKIHRINPGLNRLFDGPFPAGDDVATEWPTGPLGEPGPEGIDFHNGFLYIIGKSNPMNIAEVTPDGHLNRTINLAKVLPVAPADLTWAPASTSTQEEHIYVVARGVDNNIDPNENDGMLYEIAIPPSNPLSSGSPLPPDVLLPLIMR